MCLRANLGMVFQAYSLFPNIERTRERRFRPGGTRDPSRQASKAGGRAAGTGGVCRLVAERYPHELSGGQQQRVALAHALCAEPRLLLLDEPLSALDAKVRAEFRDEIRRIRLEVGITSLFVTHDQEEALSMADHVGVMRAGHLEQLGPPAEVYSTPVTSFVAGFVGSVSRLQGEVVAPGTVDVMGSRLTIPASAGGDLGAREAR